MFEWAAAAAAAALRLASATGTVRNLQIRFTFFASFCGSFSVVPFCCLSACGSRVFSFFNAFYAACSLFLFLFFTLFTAFAALLALSIASLQISF